MHDSLLSTKLYVPPRREDAVARPRLTERLRAGVARPQTLTLLSGPAGAGKTTLLSEFARAAEPRAAWLSLDSADDDPRRFWTFLIAACQTAADGVARRPWRCCAPRSPCQTMR